MRRREFIAGLGSAAAWQVTAQAQQAERVRRIGWLIGGAESDRGWQDNVAALREALAKLGWIEGGNLRTDLRFAADDPDRVGALATELIGLAPDVMVTSSGAASRAVHQQTYTIPIVFTAGGDATADGSVRNIARPEGNITGFSLREPSVAAKWLELLKEAAPRVTSVALLFNPELAPTNPSYISSIDAAAPALGIQTIKMPFRTAVDITRAIDAFAAEPHGALLVLPPAPTSAIRDTIFQLATEHRLPAVYSSLTAAAAGGLLAYATDLVDQHRRAASYVDRILRGTKINELPVQFPTKFNLVINLRAARAIGLDIPPTLIARADEVIE
jgi:putative ABC transport system substrate-binding protein